MKIYLSFLISVFLFVACGEEPVPVPKPRMFPKVKYPSKSYQEFSIDSCPFKMNIPKYFSYQRDSININKGANTKINQTCWFDLHSKELNSFLHLSYVDINESDGINKLIADAFEMADKHNIKANYRDELKINDASRSLYGIVFEIDGPVATPLQFFVTDSTDHFLRGSLYFKSKVNPDSIAPVYKYLKEDITVLLESFTWL